jgi:hypothetical protein
VTCAPVLSCNIAACHPVVSRPDRSAPNFARSADRASGAGFGSTDRMASTWTKVWSEAHGAHYYQDSVTGETTWTEPADYVDHAGGDSAPSGSAGGVAGAGGWSKVWSDSHGAFYFQHADGRSAWEEPPGYADAGSGETSVGAAAPAAAAEVTQPLGPGWVAVWSEPHGAHYFQRADTGETTWEAPVADTVAAAVPPTATVAAEQTTVAEADAASPPPPARAAPPPPLIATTDDVPAGDAPLAGPVSSSPPPPPTSPPEAAPADHPVAVADTPATVAAAAAPAPPAAPAAVPTPSPVATGGSGDGSAGSPRREWPIAKPKLGESLPQAPPPAASPPHPPPPPSARQSL